VSSALQCAWRGHGQASFIALPFSDRVPEFGGAISASRLHVFARLNGRRAAWTQAALGSNIGGDPTGTRRRRTMQIDSLTHLSKAIEAAIEAAAVPALVLVAIALLVLAVQEIIARARRRAKPAAGVRQTARRTQMDRTRGAET
jgi:hypothetical protein